MHNVSILLIALCGAIFSHAVWAQNIADMPIPETKPQYESQDAGKPSLTSPPIPEQKPAYTPRKKTALEKLMRKARKPLSQKPLSSADTKLYKMIFAAQEDGDFKAANAIIKDIDDPRLLGHVLFQRYMHPDYTSKFAELETWLTLFADHPGANRIYRLANARTPQNFSGRLRQPETARGLTRTVEPTMRPSQSYVSPRKRSDTQQESIENFKRSITALIRKDAASNALERLNAQGKSLLDPVEFDLLRADIAASYLYQGYADKALTLANESIRRSGLHVPKAGWIAGLASWRAQDYDAAAKSFEIVGRSPYVSGWTAAAGAYWAARAHMKLGDVKAISLWLKRATAQPRTFYGLVATRALGRDFDFNWQTEPFTKDALDILMPIPAANRAMALVMAGQPHLAESELIRLRPSSDEEYQALLAYAGYANLPGFALRLATAAEASKGGFYDAALYPMGPWQMDQDYKIDPALVYAIMRQESRFDPSAESPSGARGLMQLMPATAKALADGDDETQLDHPETNLDLGRKYLEDLLETQTVQGNLLYLLIAYNAGPGNLAKWKKRWKDVKDPLLFIELIPSSETRTYVERVLSNYWIYRLRENAQTPTLDAMAAGQAPLYNAQSL